MNEFSTYECTVRQCIRGKWLLARIGMICVYILFVFGWLILGLTLKIIVPLLALIPITTWLLVFCTWRYVSVEYEYSITSGVFTFSKVFGSRSRRKCLSLSLKEAVRIAPLSDSAEFARATAYTPELEFCAVSSMSAPDIYFILFEHEQKEHGKTKKRRAILYFEATARALQLCRFYNMSATVVTDTQR